MNDRAISVDESIFDVCTTHPEVVDIMAGLGFDEITRPGRLATVGRFMTLAKGCRHKGITLDAVVDALRQSGFEADPQGAMPLLPASFPRTCGTLARSSLTTGARRS